MLSMSCKALSSLLQLYRALDYPIQPSISPTEPNPNEKQYNITLEENPYLYQYDIKANKEQKQTPKQKQKQDSPAIIIEKWKSFKPLTRIMRGLNPWHIQLYPLDRHMQYMYN